MKRQKLFWKVYPYYFVVILLSLLLAALYGRHEMRVLYTDEVMRTLEARARISEHTMRPMLAAGDTQAVH